MTRGFSIFAPAVQEQRELFAHELRLYGQFGCQTSMTQMTDERYERLRHTVSDFLQYKTNGVALARWDYADVYTVLSVFRDYHDRWRYSD